MNKMPNAAIYLLLLMSSVCLNVQANNYENCGKPEESELVGKTFVAVPGCIAGESYQTTTLVGHCICWKKSQKCGYICDNEAIPPPGSEADIGLLKGLINIV